MANTSRKVQLNVLVTPRNVSLLKVAAKAYRSASLNWFVGEMIECMLNPGRWQEFQMRLMSGAQQMTLPLGQSGAKGTPATSDHRPKRRGALKRKKVRRV